MKLLFCLDFILIFHHQINKVETFTAITIFLCASNAFAHEIHKNKSSVVALLYMMKYHEC